MVKTATILYQLAFHIHFHIEVVSGRMDGEAEVKPDTQEGGTQKGVRKLSKKEIRTQMTDKFSLAKHLLEYLLERSFIGIVETLQDGKEPQRVKGQFIVKSTLYIEPIFSINILPTAMNLPMVCPPVDWRVADHRYDKTLKVNRPTCVTD